MRPRVQPGVSEGAGGVLVRGEEDENVGVVRQARVEGWVGWMRMTGEVWRVFEQNATLAGNEAANP